MRNRSQHAAPGGRARAGAALTALALALTLLPALAAPTAPPARAAEASDPEVERVAGRSRTTTPVAVSARFWSSSATVLVATARNYPDALAAGALAARLDAPLLLTEPGALPDEVGQEIVRLRASQAIILGGTAAVSEAVANAIRGLSTRPTVERIAGASRFDTAASVARRAGTPASAAVVALGTNFPDAVAAGSLSATRDRLPVLLTTADKVPDATLDALRDLEVAEVLVVGGRAVIRDEVLAQLEAAGFDPRRLAGPSRFATSAVVAAESLRRFPPSSEHRLVLATGEDFPDAITAGALAARLRGPLLLVPRDNLGDDADIFIRGRTWGYAVVLGGTAAVSERTVQQARDALGGGGGGGGDQEPAPVMQWAPVDVATVHPGVQMVTDGSQCTANFVYTSGTDILLGMAAHCAGLGEARDTDGCLTEALPVGHEVTIRGADRPGRLVYSSWVTMKEADEQDGNICQFNDFALVRVDPADHDKVNPTVPFWGGPAGLNTGGVATSDEVYSYGDSVLRRGIHQLSPKSGYSLGTVGDDWGHWVYTVTPGIPGDSGSAFLADDGTAFGVLANLAITPFPGANVVSDLPRMLGYVHKHTSLRVRLAEGTEPFSPALLPF